MIVLFRMAKKYELCYFVVLIRIFSEKADIAENAL